MCSVFHSNVGWGGGVFRVWGMFHSDCGWGWLVGEESVVIGDRRVKGVCVGWRLGCVVCVLRCP